MFRMPVLMFVNFFFFLLAVYCNLRMELKENDDWMDSVIGLFIDRCDRKAVGIRKFCIIGWLEKKVKTDWMNRTGDW